jgi:hypothetical protein
LVMQTSSFYNLLLNTHGLPHHALPWQRVRKT